MNGTFYCCNLPGNFRLAAHYSHSLEALCATVP